MTEAGAVFDTTDVTPAITTGTLGEAGTPETGGTIESGVFMDDLGDPEGGVLGERMAPIVEAVKNGTFSRSMLFTEEGLKISFMWWFIILMLGAKGVMMYVQKSKEKARTNNKGE